MKTEKGESSFGMLFVLSFVGCITAAWFTSIIICLKAGWWGLLLAGALFPPVSVIHGMGSWFGFF